MPLFCAETGPPCGAWAPGSPRGHMGTREQLRGISLGIPEAAGGVWTPALAPCVTMGTHLASGGSVSGLQTGRDGLVTASLLGFP